MALHDSDMSLWGPSHVAGLEVNTLVQPLLVMESHARMSKSKSSLGKALMKNDNKTMGSRLKTECPRSMTQHQDKDWDWVVASPRAGTRNDSLSPEGRGEAVLPSAMIQTQPIIPERSFAKRDDQPSIQMNLL